jgi:hypothetical protein
MGLPRLPKLNSSGLANTCGLVNRGDRRTARRRRALARGGAGAGRDADQRYDEAKSES